MCHGSELDGHGPSKTFEVWRRIARRRATKNVRTGPSDAFRESTYPPPYPDGWSAPRMLRLPSHALPPADINRGEAMFVECLGEQLALFRSELDGQVHAIDAF